MRNENDPRIACILSFYILLFISWRRQFDEKPERKEAKKCGTQKTAKHEVFYFESLDVPKWVEIVIRFVIVLDDRRQRQRQLSVTSLPSQTLFCYFASLDIQKPKTFVVVSLTRCRNSNREHGKVILIRKKKTL